MSTIEIILSRMMEDPTFVEAVFSDAEKALSEYELLFEETMKFKNLSRAQFDALIANPDQRRSLASSGGGGRLGESFVYVKDEGG